MTGTDYNEIINDRNRPTATIRPKGQPDRSHIAGANQTRLKMLTGNGDGAEKCPAKHFVDKTANYCERQSSKNKRRNERQEKAKLERRVNVEMDETTKQKVPLSAIFGAPK